MDDGKHEISRHCDLLVSIYGLGVDFLHFRGLLLSRVLRALTYVTKRKADHEKGK